MYVYLFVDVCIQKHTKQIGFPGIWMRGYIRIYMHFVCITYECADIYACTCILCFSVADTYACTCNLYVYGFADTYACTCNLYVLRMNMDLLIHAHEGAFYVLMCKWMCRFMCMYVHFADTK
jgi:hypothetical protein